jgi:hypothetical protein
MWINGSDHPQLEPVVVVDSPDITFGVDGAERADVIREKLVILEDVEVELELLH